MKYDEQYKRLNEIADELYEINRTLLPVHLTNERVSGFISCMLTSSIALIKNVAFYLPER